MLAFDPLDHGPIFGRPEGHATIGGIVAAGVAGSQRLSCGSARDHLLGFQAVSGRGEALRAGARVVKNVTGYDLPRSEEHTSELQSLMRISYAVFCLKKNNTHSQ